MFFDWQAPEKEPVFFYTHFCFLYLYILIFSVLVIAMQLQKNM